MKKLPPDETAEIAGKLWLDFETRSRCDLLKHGAYNYAKDPSTSVLCMSYAFNDGDVKTWDALTDEPFPDAVRQHIASGGTIYAHNAQFERLIFWYVVCPEHDVPEPTISQFYCTAAQARANALPGSLEDVGRAVSSAMRKDYRGAQLIKLLSIPQPDGEFNDDDTLLDEMIAYCEQDVRTMREVSKSLRQMTPTELEDYWANEHINDNGIRLDRPMARAAVKYAEAELREIQALVAEITEGEITSVRSPRMREWVMARVGPEALRLMTVYKDGEKKYSIDKSVRANLLILAEEQPDEIPVDVADVIQCADDLWASSVAKFAAADGVADEEDGRVRGAFMFGGASATGRYSSLKLQVHNFPRACAKKPDDVSAAMVAGENIVPKYGKRVTDVLKSMLRPSLIPEKGNVFVVADWAAIEGRVNPWLAGDTQGEEKLDVFRRGEDPYIINAAATYQRGYEEILADHEAGNSAQRQVGKVQELSLGFAGGAGAFAAMARNYKVLLPEHEVQAVVKGWRRANPWAVTFWTVIESAYTYALRHPNKEFRAGRCLYLYDKQHLWAMLPSGRVLCYPFCTRKGEEILYLKAAWKPSAEATEWPRGRLWKGLGCENLVQACANDLLRAALRELVKEGHLVVLHCHDEIVIECRENDADGVKARLREVMCAGPEWASGLPLAADVKVMARYGK